MTLYTGTVISSLVNRDMMIEVIMREQGGRKYRCLVSSSPDLGAIIPADFPAGLKLTYERKASDDPLPRTPEWTMSDIRHPSPKIGRTTATWLLWKYDGKVPSQIVDRLADETRLSNDGEEIELDDLEISVKSDLIKPIADIGDIFFTHGCIGTASIPHTIRCALVGRRLSEVIGMPFIAAEILITDINEHEDGWLEIKFEDPVIALDEIRTV